MRHVLHFWRDVEIFNIPDAPTPTRPGRAGVVHGEEQEAQIDVNADSEAEADADQDAGGPNAQPRSRIVQRLGSDPGASGRLPSAPLPWQDARFQAASPSTPVRGDGAAPAAYAHAVYLGVGPKQQFVDFIRQMHAMPCTEYEQYRPASGDGWLAAFMVGDGGASLSKTFVAASFAIGSGLLREGRSLDQVGAELDLQRSDFDERMEQRRQLRAYDAAQDAPFSLDWPDLLDELERARRPLGLGAASLATQIVVETVPLYRRKDGSLKPSPEQAATFLNSFFLDDLTGLLNGGPDVYGSALTHYLGDDSPAEQRLDLLADAAVLAAQVAPDWIPAGRWPSAPRQHLALAQQAAVYQIMRRVGQSEGEHSRGLMAVNGPPGTGKTTLLKEIIADVVVQRARRISALANPQALFDGLVQLSGGDQLEAPALRADVVDGTGIVVASSNNTAVQNISFELPFSCDIEHFPQAAYLREAACMMAQSFKLKRRDPWGLVAGALGAKANRNKLSSVLMGWEAAVTADPASHPVTGAAASLKPWLDQARQRGRHSGQAEWRHARQDFLDRLALVEARREQLVLLARAMGELPDVMHRRQALGRQFDGERARHEALRQEGERRLAEHARIENEQQRVLRSLSERRAAQERMHQGLEQRRADLRELHQPGWLACKLKQLLGIETRGHAAWRLELDELAVTTQASAAALAHSVEALGETIRRIEMHARQEQQARCVHQAELDAAAARGAALQREGAELDALASALRERIEASGRGMDATPPNIPDSAFLRLAPDQYHRRSLWVSAQLDRERSELFLSALRLHEASLMANAGAWFSLLRVVRGFLGGQEPRSAADRSAVWHALFFVVPVVSTTLASFGGLFHGMRQESLGWVLVDEAGQATPASVAGALWRARRAVLVGDPFQIAPVVTVPSALVDKLGAHNGLSEQTLSRWSPSEQSAQTIADRTQALGAWVGEEWTGLPLRIHRRCADPMFSIANRIAYRDQMVQATEALAVAPDLGHSCWIDVVGTSKGKVVGRQIDAVRRILETWLANWPQVIDGAGTASPATVYVIAPFRDVAQACRELIDAESDLGRRLERQGRAVDAGTVHTFQGKEAAIVLFVLGSAQGEAGAGGRRWAAARPNLLNVALTRAQQRFYVIGNYVDWAGLPNFSELAEPAGHMARCALATGDGGQLRLSAVSAARKLVQS